MTKQFQAYAAGSRITAETPKAAAAAFFNVYPTKRKCSIIEGKVDGNFFTITYGRASTGEWPSSFKDVTKKTVDQLPG